MRHFLKVVLMLSFWGVSSVKAEELRPQLDDMVDHFINVLYGNEYGLTQSSGVVTKWQESPVNVIFQGKHTPEMSRMAMSHLNIISKLTNIKFKKVKAGTPGQSINLIFMKRKNMGNVTIEGADPKVIRTLASDPTMVCYFLSWSMPKERIIKGVIFVNNEKESVLINSCLLEELTQVMGLPNDVKAYWTSMFNPLDTAIFHSPWDMLYLKTLYDPRLKPGMVPDAARVVVRKIFKDALALQAK